MQRRVTTVDRWKQRLSTKHTCYATLVVILGRCIRLHRRVIFDKITYMYGYFTHAHGFGLDVKVLIYTYKSPKKDYPSGIVQHACDEA